MVRLTSIVTYYELKDEGYISERADLVYKTILENPDSTDREISELLGFEDPNNIRPRRRELAEMKLISENGKRTCSISKRTSLIWKANKETDWHYIRIFKEPKKRETNKEYERADIIIRPFITNSLTKSTALIIQYFQEYPHKKYGTQLNYHLFDKEKGVYIAEVKRKKEKIKN